MQSVHEVRLQNMSSSPTLTALCAGYESGEWRSAQLADDIFQRHLPSFALSFTDWNGIDGDTAARMLKKAADAVYATEKYKLRGEFGELLLHAAVKDFFGAQPAISKLHFKDSPNDTVKGFDCVHMIENAGEIELWLGEVKFYKSLQQAIADCASELREHLSNDYLRREFVAVTNKLDPAWPHSSKVATLLDTARSLDQIIDHLVVPVMLTYDSAAVAGHSKLDAAYVKAIEVEANAALLKFTDALETPAPVALHLILVPLKSKEQLRDLFQKKLQAWQNI